MGDDAQDSALTVDHLSVRLGRVEVLRDIAFSVPMASTLAVIGPNGSGKTTLFRALVGTVPSRGTIRWAPGTRIGYVPQKLDMERDLPVSGLDFLRARAAVGRWPGAAIDDALAEVGLDPAVARRSIAALSGGQFHLLLVAFALLGGPSALLLDEPTASVDEPGQARLNELVSRLGPERGVTVLLISHDLSVVMHQATQVLCLSRRRAWFGTPREVVTPETLRELYGAPVRMHVHDGD